jgi:hypothetical protein
MASKEKLSEHLADQISDALVKGSPDAPSDQDPTSAEEQDAEAQAQDAGLTDSKKVVRWYGQAGVDYREISLTDWRNAGLDLDAVEAKAVRWDAANDYTVPLVFLEGFLTEEQIQAWIVRDGRLRIEDK